MSAAATNAPTQPDAHELGLRERSKARRRALILQAAMRLFAERGYDGTTIADIAEAADVAPRTVSGYFPSKVDLATAFGDEIAGRLTATFDARPDDDVVTVFDAWLQLEAELMEPASVELAKAMYDANPALRALTSGHVAEAAARGHAAIAADTGLPPDHPMVAICMAALGGAVSAYIGAMGSTGVSAQLHRSTMTFLRGVIDATRAG